MIFERDVECTIAAFGRFLTDFELCSARIRGFVFRCTLCQSLFYRFASSESESSSGSHFTSDSMSKYDAATAHETFESQDR